MLEQSARKGRRNRRAREGSRLTFSLKICLHIAFMLLFSGLTIAAFTTWRFRKEIYRREYEAAFNAYTAASTYLIAHFRAHRGRFRPETLEYVFSEKFMRLEHAPKGFSMHRPRYLQLFDRDGHSIFEYREKSPRAAEDQPVRQPPKSFQHRYDSKHRRMLVCGPIISDDETIGFVRMVFPSRLRAEVGALIAQTALTLALLLAVVIAASVLFARRLLAPIEELTRAAREVHLGDLKQRVAVRRKDEIGDLCATFNDMVAGLARRIDLMHRMQEWTLRLSRKLHKERIYNILEDMLTSMTQARTYRLYLYNADQNTLDIGLEQNGEAFPSPEEDLLAQEALRQRWTQFLKPDGTINTDPEEVREMAVPLLSGQARIGVLRVGPPEHADFYTDEMLVTLQTLAQQVSVAIDNANLYEQLAEKERIESEMMLARDIQQSMLPKSVPELAGYEIQAGSTPAYEVGGDYFDYVMGARNRCHFLIADVAGKGVAAAMIMSIVRSLFHTYLEFETEPRVILKNINRRLSRDIEPGTFVTISEMALDPSRHRMVLSRAGHEPVMVRHADGRIDYFSSDGPAVGLLDIDSFDQLIDQTEFKVAPGDTIVLYTDGITEALNRDHEEFGLERLEEVVRLHGDLPIRALYMKIIEEVAYFSSGAPQSDDRTLILIRRIAEARRPRKTMRVKADRQPVSDEPPPQNP